MGTPTGLLVRVAAGKQPRERMLYKLRRLCLAAALAVSVGPAAADTTDTVVSAPEGAPAVEAAPAAPRVAETPPAASTAVAGSAIPDQDEPELDALPDAPVIDREVKAESAELEQVRAAEESAHVSDPVVPEDPASRAASQLGLDSPLRRRLRDVLERDVATGLAGGRIALLPELDHDLRQLQAEYDIPIDVNEGVAAYVRFFQGPVVRKHFVKWLGRSHRYIPTFRRILREEGLPEDTVYLAMIESGFANLATSRAKAVGPWQFIPETGKRMGLRQDFWVDERRDPEKAARGAAKYLKELYRQTGDWRLAWAGYNAGVGKIFKARARGETDFWTMARGRVLKGETKGYVPKLMAAAIITKHPEAFGFTRAEIEPEAWQEYERVTIDRATPLSAVARAVALPEKSLLELNPELRRTCTPPRPFAIKIPKGRGEAFAQAWPAIAESTGKLAFSQHRVARGESLRTIARAYRIDERTLVHVNGLRPARRIPAGTELVIPMNALAREQGVAFASAERAAQASRPEPRGSRSRKAGGSRGGGKKTVLASSPGRSPGSSSSSVSAARTTIRIRSGDSLWGIAQRFGVAVDELCRWNGIRNARSYKLQAGRALVVHTRRNTAVLEPRQTGTSRAG